MAGELVLSPEEQARQEAANYLASQGVGGYSPAPAPAMSVDGGQSTAPIGPPPPPAPAGGVGGTANAAPSVVGPALKRAAISTAASFLGGPVIGHVVNTAQGAGALAADALKDAPAATPDGAKNEPAGPPAPPAQDIPLVSRPSAGQVIAPAGMYPNENKVETHLGRAVPREAKNLFGAATELQLAAADKQAQADRDYYHQVRDAAALRMQANDDAAAQHQLVQIDRGMAVQQRMAEIEQLNQEASAAIRDPWNDRSAGAKVLGALTIALGGIGDRMAGRAQNGALAVIQNAMNSEVATQLKNRELAAQKAGRAQNLLNLHLEQLGSEDKAIDATKLGLLDNVLAKIDQYAAENKATVSESSVLKLKGELLAQRGELLNKMALQELPDTKVESSQKYRPAQVSGGGGGKGDPKEDMLPIAIPASDKTDARTVLVPKDVHAKLAEMQGHTNELVQLNRDALEARAQLRKVTQPDYISAHPMQAATEAATLRKKLSYYNDQRAVLAQKSRDSSVVRDPEFKREMENGVDYTAGLLGRSNALTGDVEKLIQSNSNQAQSLTDAQIRGVAGEEAKHVIARDKRGFIDNQYAPTGRIYSGRDIYPERK